MARISRSWAAALVAALALAATASAKIPDKEFKDAERQLGAAAGAGDVSNMVQAIRTIGRDSSKRAVDLLINVGTKLEDHRVYEAVRDALQGMDDAEGVDHMVKTLKTRKDPKTWESSCVLLEGLIPHKGDAVTEAMTSRLDDRVPYVISAAAKALGKRRDPGAMPALIDALEKLEKNKDVPWIDTKQALTDITGEDFADALAWRDFWKVAGPGFDPANRGEKTTSTTKVREDEASQFFKEQIIAKRIMFVIDVSGSMEQEDPPIEGQGGGKRIERVKQELVRTIQGLKKDVSFNVIAYSSVVKSWQRLGKGQNLHQATPGNKASAVKWVESLKADGLTHTDEAIEKCFELLEVNTIVLLSDGAPFKEPPAQISGTEIIDKVKGLNRLRGVKIYTFCFEVFKSMNAQELLDFMEQLAVQNGGNMTLIR